MPITYLDDLLDQDDFSEAVDRLSRPIRDAYRFPPLHQLGLVVPDVERAAEELEKRGFGPFFIGKGSPVFWREKCDGREVSGKVGFAYHEGVELELLEPLQGSDFYTGSVDPAGKIVVHHLGFLVDDVDAWAAKLEPSGIDIWVRGQLKVGVIRGDFAYLDSNKDDGPIMEFFAWHLFGIPYKLSPRAVQSIGRIQKWTGKRCLSV
jgi:catechol 2,3-dioxygenase-like lactoylglutathione lyase family enzyme